MTPTRYGRNLDYPEMLRDAIVEAKAVSLREHVKADRVERVGILVTILRRNLPRDTSIYNVLTNKSIWYDIGVLEEDSSGFRLNCTLKMVKFWLGASDMDEVTDRVKVEHIRNSIKTCNSLSDKARDINHQSELLLKQFCDTFGLSGEEDGE